MKSPIVTLAAIVLVVATLATAQLCPRANTPSKAKMFSEAKAVLDGNWVSEMNSTLPSPNLYPHQWSWDASFVSMGYSHYDTRRAIDETDALFRGQWRNGHIPHIVFNPSAVESYFPGPDFWKIETAGERGPLNPTSGITQPPVHALASLAIYENAPDALSKQLAMEHLEDIYPKLSAWHNYLYRERDPYHRNLVFIRHMWESGMDNSPAWDPVLASMKLTADDIPPYKRVDKAKVGNHNERPDGFFYDRAVHLIKVFYDNDYDEARIAKASPFLIEDVLFNSILARAGIALGRIAEILNKPAEEIEAHRSRSELTAVAISEKLYDEEDGFFYDYDLVSKTHIKTRISGGLAGVFGAKMSDKQLDTMVKAMYEPGFLGEDLTSWTIPSVSRDDPGYTNTTYWKGPAWINVNYLVREGLLRYGDNKDAMKIATFLKERSLELLEMSGFYEYFNPISGAPHGGHQFSWSAALAIDWVCGASVDDEVGSVSRPIWQGGMAVIVVLAVMGGIAMVSSKKEEVKVEKDCSDVMQAMDDREDGIFIGGKSNIAMEENLMARGNMRPRHRARHSGRRRA